MLFATLLCAGVAVSALHEPDTADYLIKKVHKVVAASSLSARTRPHSLSFSLFLSSPLLSSLSMTH